MFTDSFTNVIFNLNLFICCPISAVILTTSELEANLENQRLASVLYAREKGGGGQGCREGEREAADHMMALIWL